MSKLSTYSTRLGYAGAVVSTGSDIAMYQTGQMSGGHLAHRTTFGLGSVGVALSFGSGYGIGVGIVGKIGENLFFSEPPKNPGTIHDVMKMPSNINNNNLYWLYGH